MKTLIALILAFWIVVFTLDYLPDTKLAYGLWLVVLIWISFAIEVAHREHLLDRAYKRLQP